MKFERNYQQYSISPVGAAFLVLFVSFFMYQFVGGLITYAFVGLNITRENAGYVRLFTSISQIIFMLLLSILFAKLIYNDFVNVFRTKKIYSVELLVSILGLAIIVIASQIYLYIQTYYIDQLKSSSAVFKQIMDFLETIDKLVQKSYKEILYMDNFLDYASIVLSVALVPAFCEEFLFRGFVQSSFEKRFSIFWTIVITSLIFAIFHFNPFAFLPLFLLGAYFSYLVYLTDSIFYSVILHFLNNFFTVTIYGIYKTEDVISAKPELNYPVGTLAFSLVLLIFLMIFTLFILKREVEKRKLNQKDIQNEDLS